MTLKPLIVLALAAPLGLTQLESCGGGDPSPDLCANMAIKLDTEGNTVVYNGNDSAVTLDIDISSYRCSSSGCTWTGAYKGESLAANAENQYTANIAPEVCTMVYCCDVGYTGESKASVYVREGACSLTAVAQRKTCDGASDPTVP